jgi:hypothetical protein
MDRSDRGGAYTLAMRLRKRAVRREADTKTAQELFLGLTSVYPDTVEFQYDLALAYRDAGRPDDARRVYAGIATSVPAEARARHELAVLEEDRGALGNALALYDASIRLRENEPKPDLAAHLSKTSLLLWKAHDLAAAKDAFAKGVAAVAAAAPGPERDDYASRFDAMKTDLAVVETRHARLRDVRRHLDAVLWGVAAAWAAVLGGGVAWLRRAKWL